MAGKGVLYRYWDSCAFLGWLKQEPDKKEGCGDVLAAAEQGAVILVTSTLTIAEVLHTKGKTKIEPDHQMEVEAFFKHHYITTRGLDRSTAEFARRLVWSIQIEPKDAIHVATALVTPKIDRFETTDQQLVNRSPISAEGRGPLTIAYPEWRRDRTLDDALADRTREQEGMNQSPSREDVSGT
jgi:hypothetical protein